MALEKDFFLQAAIALFALFYLLGFGLTVMNINPFQSGMQPVLQENLAKQSFDRELGPANLFYANTFSFFQSGLFEFATPVMIASQAFNEGFAHGFYFNNLWNVPASNYFIELIPFFALKAFGLIMLALLSIELFYFIIIMIAKVMMKEIYRQESYVLKQPFIKADILILIFGLIALLLSALIKPFLETGLQSSIASFNQLFYPVDFLILCGMAVLVIITGYNAIQKLLIEINQLKKPID